MARRRKRCRFCGELFHGDPRLKGRQYACPKAECQKERHRRNCAGWNDMHSEQFEGRYPGTKAWLAAHPGYLASYRAEHPVVAEEHRRVERKRLRRRREAALDIQDSISLQRLAEKGIECGQGMLDIQDSIRTQLFVAIGLSLRLRVLDIQDSMAPRLPAFYASGKEVWRWAGRMRAYAGG